MRKNPIVCLAKYSEWWQTPLGERRERTTDLSIEPIFFSC